MVGPANTATRRKAAVAAMLSLSAQVVVGDVSEVNMPTIQDALRRVAKDAQAGGHYPEITNAAINWADAVTPVGLAHANLLLRHAMGRYFGKAAAERYGVWEEAAGIDPSKRRRSA